MPWLLQALFYLAQHECSLQVFTVLTEHLMLRQTSEQHTSKEQFNKMFELMRFSYLFETATTTLCSQYLVYRSEILEMFG